MKFFCFIFSVYILFLSTIHCSENKNCVESKYDQIAASQCDDNCNEETACSPFCVCSCAGCQGFNIETTPLFATRIDQTIETKVPSYESDFVSQFVANIWQPPKI